jgi:gas vesicle protein
MIVFIFGLFVGGMLGALAMALAIASDEDRR